MTIKLICFDLDGTLVDRDTNEPLPHVVKYFVDHGNETQYAICTNQGGVGLRYWMESSNPVWGKPEELPTEGDAINHIIHSLENTGIPLIPPIYVCYRYLSKKGQWSPIPPGLENDLEWQMDYRKPAPGLIIRAMDNTPVSADETLMVGDSEDDQEAAKRAGVQFQWAWEFFNREKP